MKFGANLQTIITPEWRSQYVEYEDLKEVIYQYQEELSNLEGVPEEYQRMLTSLEEGFFAKCDGQLSKVNNFYCEKLAEATRKHAILNEQFESHKEHILSFSPSDDSNKRLHTITSKVTGTLKPNMFLKKGKQQVKRMKKDEKKSQASLLSNRRIPKNRKEKLRMKTVKEIKFAFSEFYLSLILLQNFKELNFTAFRKILKKHDKVLNTEKGEEWRRDYVETSPFYTDTYIREYIKDTEETYIGLEGGDRTKAMKRLRVPPLSEKTQYPKNTVLKVGFFFGMCLILLCVFIWGILFVEPRVDIIELFHFYRTGFVVSGFLSLLGLNILAWRKYGVNHVLIFELNPRDHLSHQHLFEISGALGFLWTLSMVTYVYSHLDFKVFPITYSPGLLYVTYFIFLFNPFPCFFHKARRWLLYRMWRLLACGFYRVEFADFWLADQLNSLVVLFTDFEFIVCFYSLQTESFTTLTEATSKTSAIDYCAHYSIAISAISHAYPAWIRFVQCLRRYYDTRRWFPHLVNAGKYSTNLFKNAFKAFYLYHKQSTGQKQSVYFVLWIATQFISTVYSFAWDVKMDWGFLSDNAGENRFLREEIIYLNKYVYYIAVIENFIIRFSWVIVTIIDQTLGGSISLGAKHIAVILEMFRRFVWNFFRLENEHINNVGEFRAVRDISITPFQTDDQHQQNMMIDESDGAESAILDFDGKHHKSVKLSKMARGSRVGVMKNTDNTDPRWANYDID